MKSVPRDRRLPATCFMMTAMQFVFGSRATCSVSSGSWATALSAQPLLDRKAVSAPSIRAFDTPSDSTDGASIVLLDRKIPAASSLWASNSRRLTRLQHRPEWLGVGQPVIDAHD